MSLHIPDDVLCRFVAGDLDETSAVEVARHLDTCVSCATRAAALEPLGPAFASVDDPVLPEGFAASVLAEVDRRPFPFLQLGVGIGFLVAAVALIALVEGPVTPVVDSLTFAKGTSSVFESLTATLSLGEQAAIMLLAAVGVIATIRFAIRPSAKKARRGDDRSTA